MTSDNDTFDHWDLIHLQREHHKRVNQVASLTAQLRRMDEQIKKLTRQLAEVNDGKVLRDEEGKCIDCGGWGAPAGCRNCGTRCMGG